MRNETNTPGVKKSKREENAIIIHFVLYFVLIIWLIAIIIVNIIPQITEIEKDKDLTIETYTNIERIKSTGLTFNEFITFSNSLKNDKVISEILKNLTDNFYNTNLVNTTDKVYAEFLSLKIKELSKSENIKNIDDKNKQISIILPSYSEQDIDIWWDLLTDYEFINYIESLLETFNLSTKSSIGINKIKVVEEFVDLNNKEDTLQSNIFYIPLNLDLVWDKEWIIKFLYYVENVWNIIINGKDITLNEDNDKFLYKNGRKIVIEWENYTTDYNILEHQIVDIEKISMTNYIDSSYKDRAEKELKDYIIENQWSEEFKINVDLMFYVKWQPFYKTEEFINNILQKYVDTLWLIWNALKDTTLDESLSRKLKNQNISLTQMNKEITFIRTSLSKKEKIEEIYKKAISLDEIIDPIFNSLKK
jgi:hypothetical protein